MIWLFILLDLLILAAVITLCVFAVYLWTKHRPLSRSSLTEFRNDDIYEKSVQDKKRLAHIEDSVEDTEFTDYDDMLDADDLTIEDNDITFSPGYGGPSDMEEKL